MCFVITLAGASCRERFCIERDRYDSLSENWGGEARAETRESSPSTHRVHPRTTRRVMFCRAHINSLPTQTRNTTYETRSTKPSSRIAGRKGSKSRRINPESSIVRCIQSISSQAASNSRIQILDYTPPPILTGRPLADSVPLRKPISFVLFHIFYA